MRCLFAMGMMVLAACALVVACQSGPQTGAAAIEIRFRAPQQAPGLRGVLSGVVSTIRVTVSDQTGALAQAGFDYEALSGTVLDIPEGTGRNFLVEAVADQIVVYRGVALGVEIIAGQTAQVPVTLDPAYLTDVYAPAAVDDLAAQAAGLDVELSWTAVGDDAWVGRAGAYDLRWSASTIQASNFDSATPIAGTPTPAASGQPESFAVTGLQAGQTYHFALRVRDSDGNVSAVSNEAIATTQSADEVSPNAIVDLAVGTIAQNSVELSWTATGDDGSTGNAAAYDIRYSVSDIVDTAAFNAASPVAAPPVPGPQGSAETLTVGGLSEGLTYYFAIKAADEVPNWSALSNVVSATPQDLVPPAAVTLSVSGVQDTMVRLSWNAPGDDGVVGTADAYEIRSADFVIDALNFQTASLVANSPTPSVAGTAETVDVDGLTNLVPYWFAMISHDDAGNPSVLSNVVTATPGEQDLVAPARVGDLAVDSVTAVSADLSWTAPGDDGVGGGPVSAYDVRWALTDIASDAHFDAATPFAWPGGLAIEDAGQTQTLTVSGLSGETTYYFALKARDDLSNWSVRSSTASGTTADGLAPAAVADLAVGTVAADTVSLSWTAPGDDGAGGGPVTAYDVRYSASDITDEATFAAATPFAWPGGLTIEAAGLAQLLDVTGLASDTTYFFALKAVDEGGNWSAVSNSVTAATPDVTAPADVVDLTVDAATADTVSLSWTAPGDDGAGGDPVTAYDVRYSGSDIIDEAGFLAATPFAWPGGLTIEAAGQTQTLDVDGLSSDTTYYFALKAVDEAGNWSALSGSVMAATADVAAPVAIADLAATAGVGLVTLTWTAPGDDGAAGTAAAYDIRYDINPIVGDASFNLATPVAVPPTPQAGGAAESFDVTGLTPATLYYFAIKTADEVPNWSGLSNNPISATPN